MEISTDTLKKKHTSHQRQATKALQIVQVSMCCTQQSTAVVAAGRGDAGAATARALPLRAAGDDDFLLPEKK
jgi:hypothetical protein